MGSNFTTWLDLLDHWQTLAAGLLAMLAAIGTIWATRSTANRQITASREQADRMVAAAGEQTSNASYLARRRDANEARAFLAMLDAAMTRVLAEAAWAKKTYPQTLAQTAGSSVDALTVRKCITKGAFAELRGACVRRGSPLTAEFLDLEGEIDNFALQYEDRPSPTPTVIIRLGKHADLGSQLALIEAKAAELHARVARERWGLTKEAVTGSRT
jgi:hypothetical protein